MLNYWIDTTSSDINLCEHLCLVCVGSTEQHSDYLPLGTDSLIGEAVGEEAARRAKCPVVMLPPQRVGYSPHHRAFPGCLTFTQDTLIRMLFELCSCVYDNGAEHIMLLNSHGGNQTCLQAVANEIGSKLGKRAVVVRYWDLIKEQVAALRETDIGGMGHAGELETSLLLYLTPKLVRRDRIDEREAATGSQWHHPEMFAANKIYIYKPFDEYSAKGNVGQPAYATAEKGKTIFDLAASELARLMDFQIYSGF